MSVKSSQRIRVLERDRFTCQYCGAKAPEVRLEVDHVIPRSQGGRHGLANLVTACFTCNRGKRDKLILPPNWKPPVLAERPAPRYHRREIGTNHDPRYLKARGRFKGLCVWCGMAMYEGVGGSVKPLPCPDCRQLFHGLDCVWKHRRQMHVEAAV